MRWFWRRGLRVRLMLIGIVGVGAGLLCAGLAFYAALTYSVDRTLDNEALASANDVAAMVNEGRLPSPVPVSGAQVVQVVDAAQRVVGGSVTADRLTPLLTPAETARALAGEALVIDGVRLGTSEPFRVRAVAAGTAAAPVSVVAAVPVGDVLASRRALRVGLLVAFPVVLVVLAAVAWRVIGVTLRPVEQLRSGAEQIATAGPGEREVDERLPVPEAADEVRALAITLNGMLDRLAGARERQRAFVADAAHELRSPLASMQAQLEVAERLREGGELPAELLVDLRRLAGLVEDLLLLARSDADARAPARPDRFDARALLAQVAAAHAGDRVEVTLRPGPACPVLGDVEELRRAVANLVDNAARYAARAVELAVRPADGRVVLSVSDDGPGIEVGDRERVFERFTRLDGARSRDSGGSGLGLAIVRELVTRAGGEVAFTDGAPPWTLTAVIVLPAP